MASLSCCGNCAPPRSGRRQNIIRFDKVFRSAGVLTKAVMRPDFHRNWAWPCGPSCWCPPCSRPGRLTWSQACPPSPPPWDLAQSWPGSLGWWTREGALAWFRRCARVSQSFGHLMPFLKTTDTFQSAMAVVQLGWVGQLMNWWGFLNKVGLSVIINGIPRRYLSGIEVATRWSECYWGGARGALIHRLGSGSLHLDSSTHCTGATTSSSTGRSSGRSRDHLVGCTHMLLTTELIIKLPAYGLVWLTGLGLRHWSGLNQNQHGTSEHHM